MNPSKYNQFYGSCVNNKNDKKFLDIHVQIHHRHFVSKLTSYETCHVINALDIDSVLILIQP